jgi:hypothetical protein
VLHYIEPCTFLQTLQIWQTQSYNQRHYKHKIIASSRAWTNNNNNTHNHQQPNRTWLYPTMFMFSLIPFICFSDMTLWHFHFYPNPSPNLQSYTLMSPACIPCSLFGIMAILNTFPNHLLNVPWSLMLPVVIIQGDFLKIFFLISTCMLYLLNFWHTSQNSNQHALEKLELAFFRKTQTNML